MNRIFIRRLSKKSNFRYKKSLIVFVSALVIITLLYQFIKLEILDSEFQFVSLSKFKGNSEKQQLENLYNQFEKECIGNQFSKLQAIDLLTLQNNRKLSPVDRPIFSNKERKISVKFSECLSKYNDLNLKILKQFSKSKKEPEFIFTILSHNRSETLKKSLMEGQANVKSINKSLLIVSQDGYVESIYKILKEASFKLPLRFFFNEKSCQDLRDVFPAELSNDCREKTKLEDQIKLKCEGVLDKYKNFRRQRYTSLKHHQIQMIHQLQNAQVPAVVKDIKSKNPYAFVFEEDLLVSPELSNHIHNMIGVSSVVCPHCKALNIKSIKFAPKDKFDSIDQTLKHIIDEKNNKANFSDDFYASPIRFKGFGQNYDAQINEISVAICSNSNFCSQKDYNWDQSFLSQVNTQFLSHSNYVVEHFPSCSGLHHFVECKEKNKEKMQSNWKNKTLNLMKQNYEPINVERIKEIINANLVPHGIKEISPIQLGGSHNKKYKFVEQGGQEDSRDIELCQSKCLVK